MSAGRAAPLAKLAAIVVPAALFLVMAYAVAQTAPWQDEGMGGAEDVDAIVQDIFTDHLVAFEVLGVLLTAAMIGALVIARPLVSGLDSDHYPRADAEALERTQQTSELTATFTTGSLAAERSAAALPPTRPATRTPTAPSEPQEGERL